MILTKKDKEFIEMAAYICQSIMFEVRGCNTCAKSYDPCKVDIKRNILHSYAFDLKDCGRHHDALDYKNKEEIIDMMIKESSEFIKNEIEYES